MDDHILEMRGITKTFPGVKALENVNLSVRRGEIHAICGENGAGKSTLMKILAGALTEYEGEIELEGRPVRFSGPRQAEDAGIRIIYQELNLVPQLTVADNIRRAVMSKELKKKSTGEILGRVTISAGVAVLSPRDDPDSLIERADACLYAAKRNGCNRVICEADPEYQPEVDVQVA